jgi:hypothetical protein
MPSAGLASSLDASPAKQAPARRWRGAGGRWLIWVFRAVLWAVLLLIGYRGVAAIVTSYRTHGGPAATTGAAASGRGQAFPAALATAYALEFSQAYLNFNPATAAQRASSLAAFVLPGTSPEFGWNGAGTQTLQSEQFAGIRVLSPHRAVVMLLARVNGNLIEIGVPIFASGGGMIVSGQPALLARPPQAVPPAAANVAQDQAAKASLAQVLPAFFRAYGTGDSLQLRRFTVAGHPLTGLGGVVTFEGIRRLSVPAGAGSARQIVVTVSWQTAGPPPVASKTKPARPAAVDMAYALTVVRHGGSWLVRSIGAAALQPWPPP